MVAGSAEHCCENSRRQTQPATLTAATATSSVTAEHPIADDIGLPADDGRNLNTVYLRRDGCPRHSRRRNGFLLIPTDRCIRTLSIAQYWRQDWKRSFADIERDWKFEERLRKGQAECRTALWDPLNAVIDNVNRVESMTPEGLMGNLLWYGSSITLELCNIDEAPDWRVQRRTELKNQAIAVVVSGTLPL
jgi:hypothetical protein